jgi:hypothetical protein
MRRDIRQICLFENIAQGERVCVARILYNNTAEKTRRRRYMALSEAVT